MAARPKPCVEEIPKHYEYRPELVETTLRAEDIAHLSLFLFPRPRFELPIATKSIVDSREIVRLLNSFGSRVRSGTARALTLIYRADSSGRDPATPRRGAQLTKSSSDSFLESTISIDERTAAPRSVYFLGRDAPHKCSAER